MSVDAPKQAVVIPALLTFEPTGPLLARLTLSGQKDIEAEEMQQLQLVVQCESADKRFHTACSGKD